MSDTNRNYPMRNYVLAWFWTLFIVFVFIKLQTRPRSAATAVGHTCNDDRFHKDFDSLANVTFICLTDVGPGLDNIANPIFNCTMNNKTDGTTRPCPRFIMVLINWDYQETNVDVLMKLRDGDKGTVNYTVTQIKMVDTITLQRDIIKWISATTTFYSLDGEDYPEEYTSESNVRLDGKGLSLNCSRNGETEECKEEWAAELKEGFEWSKLLMGIESEWGVVYERMSPQSPAVLQDSFFIKSWTPYWTLVDLERSLLDFGKSHESMCQCLEDFGSDDEDEDNQEEFLEAAEFCLSFMKIKKAYRPFFSPPPCYGMASSSNF